MMVGLSKRSKLVGGGKGDDEEECEKSGQWLLYKPNHETSPTSGVAPGWTGSISGELLIGVGTSHPVIGI